MNGNDFSLNDWLDYLENCHQQEIQLGLTRIKTVASFLNLLHLDAKVITVAGTNGKGSTVAALEAIYIAAGYRVASYTSPHLLVFNERIRIDKQFITDRHLCAAFKAIEQGRGDIHLTYFEMATLAALWYFKQCKLDIIILEVGLGGRLDATNIIDSDLAIITTVDVDHQEYLGDTIEAIGHEKAGILRPNQPFIYADTNPPASIIKQAALLNAQRINYSFTVTEESLNILPSAGELIGVPLPCIHPQAAASAIIASICLSATLPVALSHWQKAMQDVFIPGRQQVIEGHITTIFDVAHNPQAVLLLADCIKRYQPKGKVHAVFSGLKDKDLCGLIKPMHSYVDFWYPSVLSSKRAASKELLLKALESEHCSVSTCFTNPLAAYREAVHQAKPGDLIVVYGSFLTVGAVMVANHLEQEELV